MTPAVVSSPETMFDTEVNQTETHKNTKYVDGEKMTESAKRIIWFNILLLTVVHAAGIYGGYLFFTEWRIYNIWTFVFFFIYGRLGGIGITAGVHRYWAHKSYKATLPFRIILMVMQSMAGQTPIYDWVRDHRVHHKFTDTDADPYNSSRGFFFSHVGWLMITKHPEVSRRGKGVDMSDVVNDPVVAFQKKYYWLLSPLLAFVLPLVIPIILWGEQFKYAFFFNFTKYALILNFTWLVNSAAHMWGYKPYDKNMRPTENVMVSIVTLGEGWHNYHHVYPWDYKAAELGTYYIDLTTVFIDFFALLGLAYDLKTVEPEMVKKQAVKHGDGHWREVEKPEDISDNFTFESFWEYSRKEIMSHYIE